MPFRIEDHPGILLKKAARLFEQAANKNLNNLNITHAQTVILIRLWAKDGQSQIELANSAGLNQSTVVRLLDRMERDELIKRVHNKNDRRIFNFYLTPKAKNACEKLEKYSNTITEISHNTLSKDDIKKLNKFLSIIVNNLENFLGKSK